MQQNKIAGIFGGLLSLTFLVYGIYHAIRISKGFAFAESLLPELITVISTQIPLIAPAIVLTLNKHLKKYKNWVFWLYPAVIGLGLLNVFLAKDPLAAGLPMIMLVFPFCIIYAIVVLFFNKKSSSEK